MRERAAVLGGGINITSAPHQGTVVRVHIPIKRTKGFPNRSDAAAKRGANRLS
jgi:signal transduction histidine kinase